jgi:serine/threonine protein kinase
MLQEVKALAELSDISDMAAFHIVRYHQAWIEDDRLHIVTDLCHSTLQVEMSKGYLRHEARQYKLLREMLLALKLIHQHGKVHLDIKPENIFLKDDKFKLGDFGLVVEESTVGEVQEGDSRYMCKDLLYGNHRDLTKVSYGIICYCASPPKNQIKRITLLMTNISFL